MASTCLEADKELLNHWNAKVVSPRIYSEAKIITFATVMTYEKILSKVRILEQSYVSSNYFSILGVCEYITTYYIN